MSKIEKKYDGGVSSRLKNDLLENQAWWPITLKNDGSYAMLTVDPTLFASDIDTADELLLFTGQEVAHESKYPGIRVEYLKTNSSKSAVVTGEGTCTLAITGSGTWNAQVQITWPDSTTSTIPLVAQGHAGQFVSGERYQAFETLNDGTKTLGPAPVPMTIQELADILDTFTKRDGSYAAETPSGRTWKPHPNEHIYLPDDGYNVAPAYSSIAALSNWLGTESNAQVAATVFMPMVANMNQYSRNMDAEVGTTLHDYEDLPSGTDVGDTDMVPRTGTKGIDRFDPDPEGDDASNVEYGFANQMGDHKWGHRRFGSLDVKTLQHENGADTTTSPNPKWRTRMCLAMFLKDGTYTISAGGALIPYVYDPRREVGGEHYKRNRGQHATQGLYLGGDGLYGFWEPAARSSESVVPSRKAYAMIAPGIDFVQGPFSPGSIAWNFEQWENINLLGKQMEGGYSISGSYDIFSYDTVHAVNAIPVPVYAIAYDSSNTNLDFFVDVDDIVSSDRLAAGNWIYVDQIPGNLGWSSSTSDANGWWKIASVLAASDSDSPSGNGYRIRCDCGFTSSVTKYTITGAHIRMGRPQPARLTSDSYYPENYGGWDGGGVAPGVTSNTSSIFGTVDDLIPGIGNHSTAGTYNTAVQAGMDTDGDFTHFQRRQVHITGSVTSYSEETYDDKDPTPSLSGGVGIRIPPQYGDQGHTDVAVSGGTYGNIMRYKWFTKSLLLTMWSCMDQTSGRHAWDYIKPKDSGGNQWVKGRNRPWPGQLRANTAMGASPVPADLYGTYTDAELDTYDNAATFGIPTDKYGLTEWGVSPIFADIEISAYIPMNKDRVTKIWFERGQTSTKGNGYRSFHHNGQWEKSPTGVQFRGTPMGYGHYPISQDSMTFSHTVNSVLHRWWSNEYTTSETWWWAWGGSTIMEDPDIKAAIIADGATLPLDGLRHGWGNASNHIGSGGSGTAFDAGMHTLRFAFFRDRLIHHLDGKDEGDDMGSQGPVYGFTFEHGALVAPTSTTGNIWKSMVNKTGEDPVINTIKVREIPTAAMLPFKAETITYNVTDVAKYRELFLIGKNMTADQYVRVSICAPGSTTGSWDGFGQAPGTPYTGFEDIDPEWVGGFASIDLTTLPAAALTDGFTIRFEWTIKTASHGSEGVFDWDKMPAITEYSIDYDLTPTATIQVTAETYNGDVTAPIDTRVGHIVSFRVSGSTLDPDRVIKEVKFDYGDGVVTDWLSVSESGTSVTYDINHSYVNTATGLLVKAKVRDDNLNESDWTSTITINVANAPPVAVLRASPSLIRAGDTVRLDAGRSYDIEEGGTVSDFTFTPGDGSSAVGPQAQNYTNHTYATAGEYMATVTCKDANSLTSNTARAVIKVLPARHTVPLVLNTNPSSFARQRSADYSVTQVLDSDYPEVSDLGTRNDEFTLQGVFLHATAELDIDFMEDLLATGHLVEFEWMSVNYSGTPDSRTFVGRVISFSYNREGGAVGQTPWSATLVREAGVGE